MEKELSVGKWVLKAFLILWFGLSFLAAVIAYPPSVAVLLLLALILIIKFVPTEKSE